VTGIDELSEIALRRSEATGRMVAAVAFTTATSGHVLDLSADGDVVEGFSVPVLGADEDGPED
jgi:hypothetical protein